MCNSAQIVSESREFPCKFPCRLLCAGKCDVPLHKVGKPWCFSCPTCMVRVEAGWSKFGVRFCKGNDAIFGPDAPQDGPAKERNLVFGHRCCIGSFAGAPSCRGLQFMPRSRELPRLGKSLQLLVRMPFRLQDWRSFRGGGRSSVSESWS